MHFNTISSFEKKRFYVTQLLKEDYFQMEICNKANKNIILINIILKVYQLLKGRLNF